MPTSDERLRRSRHDAVRSVWPRAKLIPTAGPRRSAAALDLEPCVQMRFLSLPTRFQLLSPGPEATRRPAPTCSSKSFMEADVGLVHVGLDGTILRANRNFCELLGYSESEIVGRDKLALVAPDDRASLRRDIETLRRGERRSYAAERSYLNHTRRRHRRLDGGAADRQSADDPPGDRERHGAQGSRGGAARERGAFQAGDARRQRGPLRLARRRQQDLSVAALEIHARLRRGRDQQRGRTRGGS